MRLKRRRCASVIFRQCEIPPRGLPPITKWFVASVLIGFFGDARANSTAMMRDNWQAARLPLLHFFAFEEMLPLMQIGTGFAPMKNDLVA